MRTRDVSKHLGITHRTLYNYRKRLGIIEETREEVSDEQLKLFSDLARSRIKPKPATETRQAIIEQANSFDGEVGTLEINQSDSIELVNLKKQYNGNQKLIAFLDIKIQEMIRHNEPISKTETDMMEKYQKLNLSLLRSILSVNPEEDTLKKKIAERLALYGV